MKIKQNKARQIKSRGKETKDTIDEDVNFKISSKNNKKKMFGGKGKAPIKSKLEDSSGNGNEFYNSDTEVDNEENVADDSAAVEGGNNVDGFSDMLTKILSQNISNVKVPVLAKRKTAIMRDIQTENETQERLKKRRKEQKEQKHKQLIIPDISTANEEKQLKKLATRGVVALFNAIAKSKREAMEENEEEENHGGKKQKQSITTKKINTEVKQMSKENFLGLLKGEKVSNINNSNTNSKSVSSNRAIQDSDDDEDNDDSDDESLSGKKKSAAKGSEEKKWAPLRDDFLIKEGKGALSLKDWDKDDSSEGNDSDEDDLHLSSKTKKAGSSSKKSFPSKKKNNR